MCKCTNGMIYPSMLCLFISGIVIWILTNGWMNILVRLRELEWVSYGWIDGKLWLIVDLVDGFVNRKFAKCDGQCVCVCYYRY
jgi:hypothetical protein